MIRIPYLFVIVLALVATIPASATVVRFDTPVGTFYVDLFETRAPNTVANFLQYLRDGDYDNSIVHRAIAGFVIQGGGFTYVNGEFGEVPTDDPIANEFGVSNTRGTIAMAKISGDPDSATSQWFINMGDNTALDDDNGGFTVFGEVLGNGMQVVDLLGSFFDWELNALGRAFEDFPLLGFVPGTDLTADNIISVAISEVESFTINAGISGTWFNEDTAGQGWFFDVIDQGTRQDVFVAWFTYDINEPASDENSGFGSTQHRWFTGIAGFEGDTVVVELRRNSGGVFNDPRDTASEPVGTLTATFSSCGEGEVSFDFLADDVMDATVPIIRLSPDTFCGDVGLPPGALP